MNSWEFEGKVQRVTNDDRFGVKVDVLDDSGQYPDEITVEVGAKSRIYGAAASLQKGQTVSFKGKLGGKFSEKYGKVFTRIRAFDMQVRGGSIGDVASGVFGGAKVTQRNAPDDDDLGWK